MDVPFMSFIYICKKKNFYYGINIYIYIYIYTYIYIYNKSEKNIYILL